MTYSETLAYLYRLLPMYQRIGKAAYHKDLTRTQQLCWELGLPQWRFRSLHIAGTNGKGSVAAMLASVMQAAGYKVGLYTSPHLIDFTERIRLNGRPIPQAQVVQWVAKHQAKIERIEPSFFELTVGMAFDYFAREEVDIAVVEVGLGGRLDSTNVLKPEMSIITQIGYDHMDLLGETLGEIAGEKAGIIKRFTPVVIGERHPETEAVFLAKAAELEAPISFAEDHYRPQLLAHELRSQTYELQPVDEEEGEPLTYQLDLAGRYQAQNLTTVVRAIEVLREDGWEIPEARVRQGLRHVVANTGHLGRMQVLEEQPLLICDTAHNVSGVELVMRQLQELPVGRWHVVWGMVNDKVRDSILGLLPPAATYYWVQPSVPRGLDAGLLAGEGKALGLQGEVFGEVMAGLAAARAAAQPGDLIYVGGSTFVVADLLAAYPNVKALG